MAQSSLITTTTQVRKYLIYFGIFIAVVIILQICLNAVRTTGKKNVNSPDFNAYQLANNKFGIITLPDMQSVPISSNSTPKFSVDADFVKLPYTAVNVYSIEEPHERFATQTKAKDIASKLGFENEPTVNDSKLTWSSNGARLNYDKTTQELSYNNPFVKPEPNGFSNDEEKIKENALDLIRQLNLNRPGLNLVATAVKVDYIKRSGNELKQATSPATADHIKVSVFRELELASLITNEKGEVDNDIEKKYQPIMGTVYKENYQSAPLEIIIAAYERRAEPENIYKVSFTDWNIQKEPGRYEVLTPAKAWENVKNGKGSLQELTEFGFDRFSTGKASNKEVLSFTAQYLETKVAYMEMNQWKGYLFPIYIFKGRAKLANSPTKDNANFVFYAYAINPGKK